MGVQKRFLIWWEKNNNNNLWLVSNLNPYFDEVGGSLPKMRNFLAEIR